MKILFFIIGLVVGMLVTFVISKRRRPSGTFVIDTTDPTKDVCTFELDESLNSIFSKKQILLNVKVYEDDSLN